MHKLIPSFVCLASILAMTTYANAQVVNDLSTDNVLVSPFVVESGGRVTQSFDVINSGPSLVRINGIYASLNNSPENFIPMSFDLPPNSRHRVSHSLNVQTVGCVPTSTVFSVGFAINYNDNRRQSGGSSGGLISPPRAVSITSQPVSSSVCGPSPAAFQVDAVGTQARYAWQWRPSSTSAWMTIVNGYNRLSANGPTYFFVENALDSRVTISTPPGVTLLPHMDLQATVSNMCGSITSRSVVLDRRLAPTISAQPVSARGCATSSIPFAVAASGEEPLTYTWRIESPSGNRQNLGTTPIELPGGGMASISQMNAPQVNVVLQDVRQSVNIDVVISSNCGTTTSDSTQLTVCVADVDDPGYSGRCDGGVTIDDLLSYLSMFERGLATADIDDGSGTGTRDGGLTIDDLVYYLVRYEAGC